MATEKKKYTVQARLDLLVGKDVLAESLADAVAQAANLKETDFVKIPQNQYMDGSMEITGAYC